MLDPRFVFLSLVLNLIASADYITRIVRGSVQPNRASWLLWTIAPAVVLAAELHEGVGLRAVMTFAVMLGPLLVLIASFTTRAAYWKLGPWDWTCGSLSGVAIAL